MLRWLVRASVAGSANSDVRSESDRASRKASDAKKPEANSKAVEDTKIEENIHPETPAIPQRKSRAKVAPKSDTKPQNTDLPHHAGPNNKYNRG